MGGELWHEMFASRGRMLEYALGFEEKIRMASLNQPSTSTCMVFCAEGFGWRLDHLEDFLEFYRTGTHRADDPFSTMEAWEMRERGIALDRTIATFAAIRRYQFDLQPSRQYWNM